MKIRKSPHADHLAIRSTMIRINNITSEFLTPGNLVAFNKSSCMVQIEKMPLGIGMLKKLKLN